MVNNPLQKQTTKYKEAYQPKRRKSAVHITVDEELAEIIKEMKKDTDTDKAIRGYAKAFLGIQ